ncbi:MarR family transcriptional regulator [uncultured Clostridium sp.]|uniref:MarR family winged helix-turn-helix transcriptional regulator n=1 Tax=uncultured Clostridium sp. TaxID=59620 RepID=UPI0025E8E59E|nr:MarR family transcriptional regulator [uncultured Clostridium sp.]
MSEKVEVINKLLVELFNDIQEIEEQSLRREDIGDLSITEIHTIEAIGINVEKTMSEIAQSLRVTGGTLTACINKLIKKGYVERNRTEADRRIVLIKLTEQGKRAFEQHKKFHDEMVHNTIKSLKDDEKAVLISSLDKIKQFFADKYNV